MSKKEANIVLFSITLCWASSYIFIKNLPQELSDYAYVTLTTGLAALLLGAVFWGKLKKLDHKTALRGFLLAVMMTGNLLAEKGGIAYVPSATASFIASLNILFVPLLLLPTRVRPKGHNVAGAVVILLGLVLTSGFRPAGLFTPGTLLLTAACLFMSVYTILADRFAKTSDPLLLGITQIGFTAVIGGFLWFLEEPATVFSLTYTRSLLSGIFLLAFFAKAYAYVMLMYAQRYADPFRVTAIAATEPVVTLVLAALVSGPFGRAESLRPEALAGACLIALGAVISGAARPRKAAPAEKGAAL